MVPHLTLKVVLGHLWVCSKSHSAACSAKTATKSIPTTRMVVALDRVDSIDSQMAAWDRQRLAVAAVEGPGPIRSFVTVKDPCVAATPRLTEEVRNEVRVEVQAVREVWLGVVACLVARMGATMTTVPTHTNPSHRMMVAWAASVP